MSTLRLATACLVALAACSPTFEEQGDSTLAADSDNDGAPDSADCAPDNPTIRPDTTEVCDGVDQDCDGVVDDGLTLAGFTDGDGDGYGDPDRPACDGGPGYSATGGDCDDDDASLHPDSADGCDGIDNDCDSEMDEDGVTTVYIDIDGDGYGDAANGKLGCEDGGWVALGGDCDDYDPAVSPLATEMCDTVDNDCDGSADNGGVCPCDVSWWPDTQHAYMFCAATSDWQAADDFCAGYGYRLVTFDSAPEGEWVEATVLTYADGPSWWIGFTDAGAEAAWLWSDGSPVTYTNWASGEPNNGHGGECVATTEEDCAMIKWSGTAWNDYPCGCTSESSVCEAQSELRPD